MQKCKKCNNLVDDYDCLICKECANKEMTLDNVILIGKENPEDIIINGFLADCFRNNISELEDIILKAILERSKHDPEALQKSIKKYCEDDLDYFIGWVDEKWNTER